MIITRLNGGLGNQMFQYAVGRAISCRSGARLKLDLSGFQKDSLRDYRLYIFNIIENIAIQEDIEQFLPKRSNLYRWSICQIKQRLYPFYRKPYIRQRTFAFDSDIIKIKKAYLSGYWQSEKYFADVADVIRNDFTLKEGLDEQNKKNQKEIVNSNSVSLHIRRGDYANNPKTRKTHGVLSLNYYNLALEMMTQEVDNPVVYVFSDDIPWVQESLKTELPLRFIDHNGPDSDYKDLELMRSCKHHIIANSSFSWWGAWLSEYDSKIVIAPKQWFSPTEMKKRGETDIIPTMWIKI